MKGSLLRTLTTTLVVLFVMLGTEARTVSVEAGNNSFGRVFIEGNAQRSVTTDAQVRVAAVANGGHRFVGWMNVASGNYVSQSQCFTDTVTGDHTLVGVFEEPSYVTMQRIFTNGVSQQNRYLKRVTTTGTATPIVFSAATVAELPVTTVTQVGTLTTDGAIIDKTAVPIEVASGMRSFAMTFLAWTDSVAGYPSELNWTEQGAFVDWNSDGKFSGAGEVYARSNASTPFDAFTSAAGYTRTIAVPSDIKPGNYRMRVVYQEPETEAADWTATYFSASAPTLRNGVAYDFLIHVKAKSDTTYTMTIHRRAGDVAYDVRNVDSLSTRPLVGQMLVCYKGGDVVTLNLGDVDSLGLKPALTEVALPAKPQVTIGGANSTQPFTRGTVSLSCTTPGVSLTYQIDGGAWKSYSIAFNLKTLGTGEHRLNVRATDPVTGRYTTLYRHLLLCDFSAPTDPKTWLDHISNGVKLSRLTIPATHESCATKGTDWHKCQNNSITDQLNLGIRVLDFRIGDNMMMYHSTTSMGISLTSALAEVSNFLNAHPSEFIILSVKDENWSGTQADWSNAVGAAMDATGKAYIPGTSADYTVGRLRGKFIIVRRYGTFNKVRGIDITTWKDNSYSTMSGGTPPVMFQDVYSYGAQLASSAVDDKWGKVQTFLNDAKDSPTDGILFFNYTSASSFSTPGDWANHVLPKLTDYLNGNPTGRYGLIFMDFVGTYTSLPLKLIQTNDIPNL